MIDNDKDKHLKSRQLGAHVLNDGKVNQRSGWIWIRMM